MTYDPKQHARRTDPQTSYDAAVEAEPIVARHAAIVEGVIRDAGRPLAVEEIAVLCDLDKYQINKRIADLRRAGLLENSGERYTNRSGRQAVKWRLPRRDDDGQGRMF